MDHATRPAGPTGPTGPADAASGVDRRTTVASTVGTVLEWYDFNLYGLASALIFGPAFFSAASPAVGILASFGTFAVGFAARPIGGLLFGHLGDRIGRKRVLFATMLVMGVATTLIGVLPTYHQVGVLAPVLLVALRVCQGIGVGGEFAGATLLTIEKAPRGRRGLYGAIPAMGTGAGFVVASAVFATVSALPDESLHAWGWRIPFLLSIVLVVFGLVVRRRIEETPAFAEVERRGERARFPLLDTVRNQPGAVLRTIGITVSGFVWGYLVQAFVLAYGTTHLGISKSVLLWAIAIASALEIGTIPFWGALSDRVGRRILVVCGLVFTCLYVYPFFLLLETRSTPLIILAMIVALPIAKDCVFGPQAALVSEMFQTSVRYSGVSAGREIGGAIFGGTAPFIGTALYESTGSILPVVGYVIAACVITIVAVLAGRERAHEALPDTYREVKESSCE